MTVPEALTPEIKVTLCAQFAVNRKWLAEVAWRRVDPCMEIVGETRVEGDTITVDGLQIVSLNAKPETRRAIGI